MADGSTAPEPPVRTIDAGHIPALDGLRGIAVLLVMAYHFGVPGGRGGFLGVDLFFVLSGFLITGILIREHRASGTIDLVRFWLRRARRLLPALFLLIAVLAIAASQANPFEQGELRWDLLASIGYVANWRFIVNDQSYFAEYSAASTVQHLWSLAIEEQFYVVWPLLVLGALSVAARSARARGVVFALLLLSTVGSAVLLAAMYDASDPSGAYFNTFSRAYELLIGAIVAVIAAAGRPAPRTGRRLVAVLVGGLVMAASLLLLRDAEPGYYRGGGVIFSLGTAAVLWGVTAEGGVPVIGRLLGLRPLVWLGTISYGVYLWHWPVSIWLTGEDLGLAGPALIAARAAATIVIAAASFHLLERPIRRGRIRGVALGPRLVFGTALAVAVATGAGTVIATQGWQPLPPYLDEDAGIEVHLVPEARGEIVLVGDSVARSLSPGLVVAAEARGYSTITAAFGGCPIGGLLQVNGQGVSTPSARSCVERVVPAQAEVIEDAQPAVVVWLSQRDRQDVSVAGRQLEAGTTEWIAAVRADWDDALSRFRATGATVVLVLPFHAEGANPGLCGRPNAYENERCTDPNLEIGLLRQIYRGWADDHAGDIVVLDFADRLCPERPCRDTLDGVDLRGDLVHFTEAGAAIVAGWILDELER